jgi:Domain of unknown function (DUF4193)
LHQAQHAREDLAHMTNDYDTPRRPVIEIDEDSLEELQARRTAVTQSPTVDLDEGDAELFELPGADLSEEELSLSVIPMRNDEFRCSRCFLVHHRNRRVAGPQGQDVCQDCA